MTNKLKLKYYSTELLQIKRGYRGGSVVNAKPYLLLSIIDLIENLHFQDNCIFFDDTLNSRYEYYHSYFGDYPITQLYKPFYYMTSDGFWHIEWKNNSDTKISSKYLRENVKYARFDNALWDLLQDTECRQTLREVIIQNFLT